MRILLVLVFVSVNILTSAQAVTNFVLHGVIRNGYAYKIYLRYTKDDPSALGIDVDEVALVSDNKFSFSGHITEPVQAYLVFDGHSTYAPVYLDTGDIMVTIDVSNVQDLTSVTHQIDVVSVVGSPSDSLQRNFYTAARKIFKSNEPDSVKTIQNYDHILQFVKQHPDHNLSSEFLAQAYLLSYKKGINIYNTLSMRQQAKAPRNGVEAFIERTKRLEEGYNFMPMSDPSGRLLNGRERAYKYMLVYFWASWGHSDFSILSSLYKKYKDKGFEILGVSIDHEKDEWINAIKNNAEPWPQVSDLKGRENVLYAYYHIPYLPFSLLIDNNGKVISINPQDDMLISKIESLFAM